MVLARPAIALGCSDDPVQRDRLRHAFKFMAAALLDDEQAGDLTLDPRRDDGRTWLRQRLRPRRDVRHVSENLARRVYYHRTRVDGDACSKQRLACALILAV